MLGQGLFVFCKTLDFNVLCLRDSGPITMELTLTPGPDKQGALPWALKGRRVMALPASHSGTRGAELCGGKQIKPVPE